MRNNYIDPEEQEELDTAQQCSKCRKTKFRSRHQELCSNTCHHDLPGSGQGKVEEEPLGKEKRRADKMKKREERREEREKRRLEKKKRKKTVGGPELGLLGNLLREVIKANTWT